jgi:hypothetical protein
MITRSRFPVVRLIEQALFDEKMLRDGLIEITDFRRREGQTAVRYRRTPTGLQIEVTIGSISPAFDDLANNIKQLLLRWEAEGEACGASEADHTVAPPGDHM